VPASGCAATVSSALIQSMRRPPGPGPERQVSSIGRQRHATRWIKLQRLWLSYRNTRSFEDEDQAVTRPGFPIADPTDDQMPRRIGRRERPSPASGSTTRAERGL
jgi:hypothetical protein